MNKILNFYDFINTIGRDRMKAKQGGVQLNVKDHNFILQLIEIKAEIPIEGSFIFELQKGCQYVHKLKQSFEFNENNCYSFGSNWKMAAKAYKEKSMTFSLGLYRNNDGFLQFVDEFQIKLCEPYQAYIHQIKNHFFYYNRVCQEINNLQQVGQSWRCMKVHLKANKTFINILSASGSMILRLSVEILNYFDTLANNQIQKKQSLRSEKLAQLQLQEKSTSSRNSLKNKKKKQQIRQTTHEKEIDLKVQSTLKPSSPTNDGSNTGTQQFFSKVEVDEKQNISQFLPINIQALRSNTILSDIIQLSNENESHMNGDKTDRRGSDMNIPNPSVQKNSFSKTKTFHFGNNQNEKMQYHRNSTMQIFHRELSNQDQDQHIPSTLPSKVRDEQLTQQSTVFKSTQDNSPIMNMKSLLLIALLYAFISYMLVSSIQTQKIDISSRFYRKDVINHKR